MNIPFCDLKAEYQLYRKEFDAAYRRVMESGHFILGSECQAFEQEYAEWNNAAHCIGVASGTDAVELALLGAGVCAGDMVATVSHTAVATVAAIERLGAVPVFVDIEPRRFTMSPSSLERVLKTFPVRAVLPVHLYGQCADMLSIMPMARKYGCAVVEDCAQAHGAMLGGHKAGTFGDAAAFSFYPTKNLGAFGDGGAVLTGNGEIAARVRSLRQYGWKKRYISDMPGFNSRLDELQAAFLRVRLCHLDEENNARRAHAEIYVRELSGVEGIEPPYVAENSNPAWHLFVTMAEAPFRNRMIKALGEFGISAAIHYPSPVHLQRAYVGRLKADPLGLHATESICERIVSLPMYAAMPQKDIEQVCRCIHEFFATKEALNGS